jgi:putative transposase
MKSAMGDFGLSQRRVCRAASWNRSSLQYRPQRFENDQALSKRLLELAADNASWGCAMLHDVLKSEGLVINHKRTERLYQEYRLSVRRRWRRKLPASQRVPLPTASSSNQQWAMDFIHDQLGNGRRFRCLTMVDTFTRQCLAIRVDTSIGGAGVVEQLQSLQQQGLLPEVITVDNGPEFTGRALHHWAKESGVKLHHIQPGKPMQNGYIESFNGKMRSDCLNQNWFTTLEDARLRIEAWRIKYNTLRPHSSIGRIPPDVFAKRFLTPHTTTQPLDPLLA